MVWQKGIVNFWTFFALFLPAALNFLVPAAIMSFAVPDEHPVASQAAIPLMRGARRIIDLMSITWQVRNEKMVLTLMAGIQGTGSCRACRYPGSGYMAFPWYPGTCQQSPDRQVHSR